MVFYVVTRRLLDPPKDEAGGATPRQPLGPGSRSAKRGEPEEGRGGGPLVTARE